jgi:hypothetical protein
MLGRQFAYSAAPVRKVKGVQFGILSPEEIVRANISQLFAFLLDAVIMPLPESVFCHQNRTPRGYG